VHVYVHLIAKLKHAVPTIKKDYCVPNEALFSNTGFSGLVTNTSILLSYLIFNFPVLNIFGAMHLPT